MTQANSSANFDSAGQRKATATDYINTQDYSQQNDKNDLRMAAKNKVRNYSTNGTRYKVST